MPSLPQSSHQVRKNFLNFLKGTEADAEEVIGIIDFIDDYREALIIEMNTEWERNQQAVYGGLFEKVLEHTREMYPIQQEQQENV